MKTFTPFAVLLCVKPQSRQPNAQNDLYTSTNTLQKYAHTNQPVSSQSPNPPAPFTKGGFMLLIIKPLRIIIPPLTKGVRGICCNEGQNLLAKKEGNLLALSCKIGLGLRLWC